MERATVRLRAVSGTPLDEPSVREMVESSARGLAERMGVAIFGVVLDNESITIELGVDKLAGLGFMAELRRATNAWYEGKYRDGPLWGTVRE